LGYKISIFTPAFNRANTINRVWESLLKQTYSNFEWIVIDDGSEDNLEEIILFYKKEAKFPIIYEKFETNKGKHIATNRAVDLADSDFFIIADSDDAFIDSAFEIFIEEWNKITDKQFYAGVRACCVDQFGSRVSSNLKFSSLECSSPEAFYKYKFRNESWAMIKTELHKSYKFPVDFKGSFYSEYIMWNTITNRYFVKFIDICTRIYYIEYNNGSLSRVKNKIYSNSDIWVDQSIFILNNEFKFIKYAPLFFLRQFFNLIFFGFLKSKIDKFYRRLTSPIVKSIFIFLLPIVLVFFILIRIKDKFIF
jgi:glycosyltransferase involved in cell wall biosynthesis